MRILVLLFPSLLFASEAYKSTDNKGLGKYERINAIESYMKKLSSDVIKMKTEQKKHKKEIESLKKQIKSLGGS